MIRIKNLHKSKNSNMRYLFDILDCMVKIETKGGFFLLGKFISSFEEYLLLVEYGKEGNDL